MKFFKEYNSLPNYLIRHTIIKCNKLHVRLHKILSSDKTPFLHNHPFNYISIVLKGNYTEQIQKNGILKTIEHKPGSVIVRSNKDYHRISKASSCTTLFFSWKNNSKWNFRKDETVVSPEGWKFYPDGLYQRHIKTRLVWSKSFNGMWHVGNEDKDIANNETRYSIYQEIKPIN